MSGRENMGNSGHRLALTQPFATKGRSPDRGSPIGHPAQVGHLPSKLLINILILFLVSGCAAPSKKVHLSPVRAAQAGIRQPHRHTTDRRPTDRHPTAAIAPSARRELSDAEKDKLFRNFMRWLAANERVEVGALVKAGQAPETGEAAQPAHN
jgi:hypothetical protein